MAFSWHRNWWTKKPNLASVAVKRKRRCVLELEHLEDRLIPSVTPLNAQVDYAVTTDWGSGFGANVAITNKQTTTIQNWAVEFDFNHNIDSIWNANIVSHTGNHYVIGHPDWSADIAAGKQASFGFNGSPGNATDKPINIIVEGTTPSGSGSGSTTGGSTGSTGGTTGGSSGSSTGSGSTTGTTPSTPAANVNFTVTDDWGSGFGANITVTNPGTAAVKSWTLAFDFAHNITSIWNAQVVSHVGNHYVISNAGWNDTIDAGKSVSFGFNGSPGNVKDTPLNYALNGTAATTTGGSTSGSGSTTTGGSASGSGGTTTSGSTTGGTSGGSTSSGSTGGTTTPAAGAPAKPTLSVQTDTSGDGSFNATFNIWYGNNGTS